MKRRGARGFRALETEAEGTASSALFSPYSSVRIRCEKHAADTLSEALLCFGASSASMDEVDNSVDLDNTWITSIFTDDQDVNACISHAADSIGLSYTPKYEISTGKPCDWVANVQETFHPIEVTRGLWIIPKWRTPVDLQAINIILDPGLAFGTGEHPTTKLCLLLLHGLIRGGERLFDYGTGSGVLGIAAVKMGAAFSVGIDIDLQAIISARQNIALNEIDSNKMSVYLVRGEKGLPTRYESTSKNPEERTSANLELIDAKQSFDIVIANILLNPLLDLAEEIVSFARPGAVIGLSGILSEQVKQIKELYSMYLDNISISEIDGWACLHGTRKRIDDETMSQPKR
ncbi:uncharacterized protein A4U43_C07F38120 [Asparagus officinalis]|uniref:ETFB lysine methyltransferase n=2 Tax=Asparagus officinalis TaxID=4686 RepID=A0A5P1EK33_ASPOF|nr:uncharacterized protein A4U43_C07F38120 [Asparagus officinalis]